MSTTTDVMRWSPIPDFSGPLVLSLPCSADNGDILPDQEIALNSNSIPHIHTYLFCTSRNRFFALMTEVPVCTVTTEITIFAVIAGLLMFDEFAVFATAPLLSLLHY